MFFYPWTPTALLSLFISSLVYFSTASAQHLLGKRLEISNLVADEIIIDYAHAGWKTEQVTYKLMLSEDHFNIDGQPLNQKLINDLFASLNGLYGSARLQECINHTDDYPKFMVKVRASGKLIAEVSSTSNCLKHVPWNVIYNGRLMAQYNGAIWSALYRLLVAIDAPRWGKHVSKDWGTATFDLRNGDRPASEIKVAQSIDVSLRAALMASPTFQKKFGRAQPQIIDATCTLGSDPECAQLKTRFSVAFQEGFRLETGAIISATGVTAWELPSDIALQNARDLTQSALLKAYLELSTGAPITLRYLQNKPGQSFEWAARAINFSGDLSNRRREIIFISVASKNGRSLPCIFFYPDLQVGWVRRGEATQTRAWFKKLSDLTQALSTKQPNSRDIFVKIDGSLIQSSPKKSSIKR